MSAKSVKGPGGKQPASAATNLIGTPSNDSSAETQQLLTAFKSWWGSRHDGGSCLPSSRSVQNILYSEASVDGVQILSRFECSCHGGNERQE